MNEYSIMKKHKPGEIDAAMSAFEILRTNSLEPGTYERGSAEDAASLTGLLQIRLHLFFCAVCSREIKRLDTAREIMSSGFFPPCPGFGDKIMEKLGSEEEELAETDGVFSRGRQGFSTASWIAAGCFMFISLATVFFGLDFGALADSQGSSFLLPVGLTIGLIVTGYGAVFIGSHLNEFRDRLRL